jgi:hypothetical protein
METVEVGVAARQGDSGGPIFNARGELAGVLWGAGGGRTAGSYCGRVRQFLASIVPTAPNQTDPSTIALAGGASSTQVVGDRGVSRTLPLHEPAQPAYAASFANHIAPPAASAAPSQLAKLPETGEQPLVSVARPPTAAGSSSESSGAESISLGWQELAGNTRLEQAKTLLAAVGIAALALHFRKFLIQHG